MVNNVSIYWYHFISFLIINYQELSLKLERLESTRLSNQATEKKIISRSGSPFRYVTYKSPSKA